MMDTFWKWLMRTNAQAVLAAGLIGLILVSGWWGWKEIHPDSSGPTVVQQVGRAVNGHAPLGLVDFLEHQLAQSPGVIQNPFLPPAELLRIRPKRFRTRPPDTTQDQVPPEIPDGNLTKDATSPPSHETPDTPDSLQPTPSQTDERQPEETPTPPIVTDPPPHKIVLTYRGILRRPDGHELALIEESETRSRQFYSRDGQLFGFKIQRFDETMLDLIQPDGTHVPLMLRQPGTFTDGTFEQE